MITPEKYGTQQILAQAKILEKAAEEIRQTVRRFSAVSWIHVRGGNPQKSTYAYPPAYELIHRYVNRTGAVEKGWVDPFAGENPLNKYFVTNDLNPDFEPDSVEEAGVFLRAFEKNSFEGGLWSPPISNRQSKEQCARFCHPAQLLPRNSVTSADWWSTRRNALARVIKVGGYLITVANHSNGFEKNGNTVWELVEGMSISTGGMHEDLVVAVFQKFQDELPMSGL